MTVPREKFDAALEGEDSGAFHQLLFDHPAATTVVPWSSDAGSLLHAAAEAGSAEICRDLLNAGAQASVLDEDGQTALHVAAMLGRVVFVEQARSIWPTPPLC